MWLNIYPSWFFFILLRGVDDGSVDESSIIHFMAVSVLKSCIAVPLWSKSCGYTFIFLAYTCPTSHGFHPLLPPFILSSKPSGRESIEPQPSRASRRKWSSYRPSPDSSFMRPRYYQLIQSNECMQIHNIYRYSGFQCVIAYHEMEVLPLWVVHLRCGQWRWVER